ncbi:MULTISPECIES: competence pheromone ComX [Bacillus]|uniref:competence pheromone ComX n=1 Tax=Bacillus TaxID=1386 RepID=UPI0004E8FCD8|nr:MULTISPECIES: competence pheromone ComX [Bacillus]AJE79842.1 competence protein [Bacillus sp. BH072]AUG37250.1 competence pheromone ComX [Bacillus velezensis]KFI15306.1 competence protein [Bacillus velezensis]KOC81767.1 competence protein [Bacillus velezensis]KSV96111.1 competence protein [Bacillus velezensis]
MNQDIVNYLMKNPEVLEKLKKEEVSLLSIPNSLIPTILEIFDNNVKIRRNDPAWFT